MVCVRCVSSLSKVLFVTSYCKPSSPILQIFQKFTSEPPQYSKEELQKLKRDLKSPPNTYSLFVQEMLKILTEKKEGKQHRLLLVEFGRKWQSMKESEKKNYREKAALLKAQHQEKVKTILEATPKEMLEILEKETELKKKKTERLKIRKLRMQENMPVKPCSSYSLFMQENFSPRMASGLQERKEFFRKAADAWKLLPESEKCPYNDKARELYKDYRENKKEWVAKMQLENKDELLHLKSDDTFQEKVMKELSKKKILKIRRKSKKAKSIEMAAKESNALLEAL